MKCTLSLLQDQCYHCWLQWSLEISKTKNERKKIAALQEKVILLEKASLESELPKKVMATMMPVAKAVQKLNQQVGLWLSSRHRLMEQSFSGHQQKHPAYDFACRTGEPIYAVHDGVLVYDYNSRMGNQAVLHNDGEVYIHTHRDCCTIRMVRARWPDRYLWWYRQLVNGTTRAFWIDLYIHVLMNIKEAKALAFGQQEHESLEQYYVLGSGLWQWIEYLNQLTQDIWINLYVMDTLQ